MEETCFLLLKLPETCFIRTSTFYSLCAELHEIIPERFLLFFFHDQCETGVRLQRNVTCVTSCGWTVALSCAF